MSWLRDRLAIQSMMPVPAHGVWVNGQSYICRCPSPEAHQTPPGDGIAHNRRSTMTDTETSRDTRATMPTGPSGPTARNEPKVAPLERATIGLAHDHDEFQFRQQHAHHAMQLPEADFTLWVDNLTVDEARDVIQTSLQLANEHRRRAETANILEARVREHLSSTARYGQDVPVSASRG